MRKTHINYYKKHGPVEKSFVILCSPLWFNELFFTTKVLKGYNEGSQRKNRIICTFFNRHIAANLMQNLCILAV